MSLSPPATPLDQIVLVLDRPQDFINIGAALRAMKNMGLSRLRLVRPSPFAWDDVLRIAHHTEDLIARVEQFPSLGEALADCTFVVGTAANPHPGLPTTHDIRRLAADLIQRATADAAGRPLALLFGMEDDGLDRHALSRCHLVATLPANPDYPALNLAQSLLLFVYELRMAALGAPTQVAERSVAEQALLERLFDLTEETLEQAGFLKFNAPGVMQKLRQMAYRAQLSPDDAGLLLAACRQLLWKLKNGDPSVH